MVTDILSDNEARVETFGRSSTLRLREDRPAAAKTGSTDDYRDSWTMGYTPSLVTGVWVGRHDDRPMRAVLGSSGAGQIWNNFMERALEGWPIEPFEQPPGMVYESRDWVFSERSREVRQQLASRAYAVDRVSGKLADFDTPYTDVVLRTFRNQFSPSGPQVPTEYSEREGPNRPWEVLTPIAMETVVPPTRTPTHTAGPSPTPDPNATPTPTRPTPIPSATPTVPAAATPTSTPLPDPSEVGATEAAPSGLP
jgi:membrane peptidoglycan carboxypeptidase